MGMHGVLIFVGLQRYKVSRDLFIIMLIQEEVRNLDCPQTGIGLFDARVTCQS